MMESKRIVAIYCRVSSDDQRDRETIKTQQDTLQRRLDVEEGIDVLDWYLDDGVSGTIPMEQRQRGSALVKAALAHRFTELWFTRASRLSRDEIEALKLFALFEGLGIKLVGISEPVGDRTMFGFSAVMNAAARRQFLADSARGMERAAREGRYTGGIVTFGYKVEGKKHLAFLVPDNDPFWKGSSASALVRQVFHWVAREGWSCRAVADHLNGLAVPTAYARDARRVGPGERKKATAGVWRPSRVRAIIVNPTYKGELYYGRRPTQQRGFGTIVAACPAIVSPELWEAAKEALKRNAIPADRQRRRYLLRGLVKCGMCGLSYCGAAGRDDVAWLRCNGQIVYRREAGHRCIARTLKANFLEELVWDDIARFLRTPGDVIEDLRETPDDAAAAIREAEIELLRGELASVPEQRNRVLDLYRRSKIEESDMDAQMDAIAQEEAACRKRLTVLEPEPVRPQEVTTTALLADVRKRLDAGLDFEARFEIVHALVSQITVYTEIDERGRKSARVVVVYRFPGVVDDDTGMGCRRRRA